MAMQTNPEHFELVQNISKALCSLEKPLDYKLTRNIILITHHLKDGSHFWNSVNQRNLIIHRFSAWKFCCLLHRLLRDGHSEVMKIAQKRRRDLQNIRDFWIQGQGHCRNIGVPISTYCQVLLIKLNFHEVYTFFSGDLHLKQSQNWELNVCFQLATDILEYLELLLQLFAEIFSDIENQKLSMKSCQAQCRLTNVLTLINECSALYVHLVTVLEVLTEKLPVADVIGINNRFYEIFCRLKNYFNYLNSQKLALKIESIPELPETVPTFGADSTLRWNQPIPTAPLENE